MASRKPISSMDFMQDRCQCQDEPCLLEAAASPGALSRTWRDDGEKSLPLSPRGASGRADHAVSQSSRRSLVPAAGSAAEQQPQRSFPLLLWTGLDAHKKASRLQS